MGSGTLTGSGWVVDEIEGSLARLATDPLTGMATGLLDPKNGAVLSLSPIGASANTVLTKYGVRAYDTCANGITIGVTTLAHSLSNERPRFQTYTRKCVLSSAASEIRFASASFTADQTEKALSIDVYIENMPNEFLGVSNPYTTVQISNTTSLGSNYSRWVFDAGYLRQGWNTLKMRQADTISAVSGTGNLPTGCNHPSDIGTGFDWTGAGQFISLTFTNMNAYTVHIDELRRPAKAAPVITIGFDASGYNATDEVFVTKVAPLFASVGIRSYCTMTNIYELIYGGSQAWVRVANLYNNYGWDVINHTWSHGGTEVGRTAVLTTLSRTTNVCTATVAAGHNLTVNKVCKVSIQGATPSDMNGVFDATVTSSTQFTYTATGTDGSATGTVSLYTYLSEIFTANNAENLRLLNHELSDIAKVLKGNGFSRSGQYCALPNNSVPELSLLQSVSDTAGIRMIRAYRGGYTLVNELGPDNPLNMGSVTMDSGTNFTKLSEVQAKVAGAVSRGDHLHIFGHYILDDEDPANVAYKPTAPDFPPGQGGNPAPPSGGSGAGGWWYLSQLRQLVATIAASGATVKSPSKYVEYMGYKS